ncbi:MAG: alpha/beta hydrolase [Candidatus Marsarchaeota archaeon]|jgi:predicted alpha/beta hydrolase family esterase|nr:alpha/beta hydrolase [Candidatus Marsarchaeota archaeon]MCL5111858.1 alpha/beta hydrolase [Candidatus Marsarchaeota archaeon]
MKAMIIPGNGNADMSEIWFPYIKERLEELNIQVIAKNMPDPELARKSYWLPFIEQEVGEGADVILIGHSSGAVAIMRYLETRKIKGAVLVGACYTNLGSENEKLAGYYDEPWKWDTIRGNAEWIIQFGSLNDPYIPIQEMRFIHSKLNTEYYEYKDQGHFSSDVNKTEFPELIAALKKHLLSGTTNP